MNREQLLALLWDLAKSRDPEYAHVDADRALIAYIGDREIADAYEAITRWYG